MFAQSSTFLVISMLMQTAMATSLSEVTLIIHTTSGHFMTSFCTFAEIKPFNITFEETFITNFKKL